MKKITFLTILLISSITFGQNLIANGDFESGLIGDYPDGWGQGYGWTYGTNIVTAPLVLSTYTLSATHSGTHAGQMLNGQVSAFIQDRDVTEGDTYIVQFWFTNQFKYVSVGVKIRSYNADGTLGAFLQLTPDPLVPDNGANASGDGTVYGCNNQDNSGTLASWKEAKFSFLVPTGVNKIRFLYYFGGTTDGRQYIDDVSIVKDTKLSLNDLERFNFISYPNPVKDYINISAAKNIDKIEIYNLLGQQVLNKQLNINKTQLNVSNLSKGVYILRPFIENAVGSYKFLKD